MSYDYLRRPQNGRHSPNPPSPLRHASNASTSSEDSSAYSNPSSAYSNPFPPSRTSTVSSHASVDYHVNPPTGHKRGISETSPTRSQAPHDYHYRSDNGSVAPDSRLGRQSLKTLTQAPNVTLTPTPEKMSPRVRFDGSDGSDPDKTPVGPARGSSPTTPTSPGSSGHKKSNSLGVSRSDSRRVKPGHRGPLPPQSGMLESSELEKMGHSATSHLRTLSKFAEDKDNVELSFSAGEQQEVAGMQGRQRLQQSLSSKAKKTGTTPGYGGRTWMDTQRQFLQAYEYLCHIGEAKDWIEEVIAKPIPPIVQLEESLRDGVVLAEVVQALQKDKVLKIFRNPKLQFRHSDNIAIFFRFLAQVELPELFRFELVDLYDKKNIPKVIYCIHALSWILLQKGMVDFRIGNLVGQLEFEHHELEATQKGLDKSGVSMPNFSGMQKNFGAEPEPEPEPKETEEERIDRELRECEHVVLDLQAQMRGALRRLRLGDTMQDLWDCEHLITDLQARIRGDFARQVSDYHLQMKTFSVGLQSISRGFLVRTRQQDQESFWKDHAKDIVSVQSMFRARQARARTSQLKSKVQIHEAGVKSVQAAIRGALLRKDFADHVEETRDTAPAVVGLQRQIRGLLERKRISSTKESLLAHENLIVKLQSSIRGSRALGQHMKVQNGLRKVEHLVEGLQSLARARQVRQGLADRQKEIRTHERRITTLQAACRASLSRRHIADLRAQLSSASQSAKLLQSATRGYLCRDRMGAELEALEESSDQIKELQAICRGSAVRTRVFDLLYELGQYEADFTVLQSTLRALSVRSKLSDDLEQLDAEEQMVILLQAEARGSLVRQQFAEKQRYFNENMKKVIKIQSFVRGRQQGEAYKSLTSGDNPPVSVVKNFVHLLNDSDYDFDEEVEVEKLRKAVGSRAREIEQTDQWIQELDAKIGLVAANKIARDEIAKLTKHYGSQQLANRSMSMKESLNLKSLNKNSRAKLELYQQLFVILQTDTIYLARLFKRYREKGAQEDEFRRLESLTMSAYGYAQRRREEFYLLRLIASAIEVEAADCKGLADFQRGSNFFFTRIFQNYTRAPRDAKFVREVIAPMVRSTFTDNPGLDLESDPLQIYRAIINDEELRTGQHSMKPLDIPREQAIKDPQTREAFVRHLSDLRDVVNQFLLVMEESLHKVPYGPRHIARQMYEILCQQFPREDQASILQHVGNWIWRTYLRPNFAEAERFGAVDRALEAVQRRNIEGFVKVFNQVACGRVFGDENVYLVPLNTYVVNEAVPRTLDIWAKFIDVSSAESHFDMDVMDDIHAKKAPTLHIKISDMFAIHEMVSSNLSSLCVYEEDAGLRDVVRELGSARSNEAEISAGSSEVTLMLSARLQDKQDPDADIKALMMETKRCILFIIRVQAGASLMDIMVKPITEEDEARWEALVREELMQGPRSNGKHRGRAYTDAGASILSDSNLADLSSLTFPELKGIALENIIALENRGRLKRSNGYQDVLNDIAIDIRLKHKRRVQRQREADNVRATLAALDEKAAYLDEKLKAYSDTFEQNLNVLQNKKGKRRFLMPFSVQWIHERELEKMGRVPRYGSFKYRAQNLLDKGVLRAWHGRDLRDVEVTIASDRVNEFTIEGSSGTLLLPGASAQFTWDDLLDAQYRDQRELRFFGNGAGGGGEMVLDAKAFMQQVSKKFWPEG